MLNKDKNIHFPKKNFDKKNLKKYQNNQTNIYVVQYKNLIVKR